ncbi:MAG TPA: ABC transporter substrate-binding protein [Solirubrobacteraceae bacterium]|nr:ABC transporter substrate-binding protein [Solirubrobacteraceae bacterium]
MSSHPSHRARIRRFALATALSVAAAGLLSACGGSSSSTASGTSSGSDTTASATNASSSTSSSTPARILIICPFSGPLAVAGEAEYYGLEAAAQVLNANGGADGHKVIVSSLDDAGSGVTAVSKAETVIASGAKYAGVLGGCFGQDALPLASVFGKSGIIDFGPVPDNYVSPPKYAGMFVGGTLVSTPEVALAASMKAKGITRFAIVTGNDTTAVLGAQALQAAAKSAGMTVTATEEVPDTAVDATPQVSAAVASHPQAIAVNNYTPVIGPILKARTTLGSALPLYGDAYFGAANIGLLTTKAERAGVNIVTFPFLVVGNPAQNAASWKTFIAADQKYNPKPLISVYADVTGYDDAMAIAAGVTKTGDVSGPALATALGNITSSSQVPNFVGTFPLFTPTVHAWGLAASNYTTVAAGLWKGGLIVPGT